jgi:predicted transglutaminase-like cysteine proteinase
MVSRVRAYSVALLLVLLPPIFGGATAALAQYQVSADATEQITLAARFPAAAEPTELSPAVPALPGPFGGGSVRVTAGGVVTKWRGLIADIRAEDGVLARCRESAAACPPAAQKFLAVIAEGRARDGRARIGVINRAINLAIQPMSDLAQWGVPDRWSAPLVTLASGRGDCEDYAIAKYVALKEAGIAESDLRLVIARDLGAGEDHAVVAARVEDKWIVLDNRRLTLIEDIDMPRVVPLFVLDHEGVKRFAPATIADATTAAAPSALGF